MRVMQALNQIIRCHAQHFCTNKAAPKQTLGLFRRT